MWIAVALATCAAVPAFAQGQLEDYAEAAGWSIAIDPSLNNGCLMMSEFEDNSVVRIGFDMTTGGGYVLSANPGWDDIEEGKTYPISILLDDKPFNGEATGTSIDGLPAADILFDTPDFFPAMMGASSLSLSHGENEVMLIDITGSTDAVVKMIECQDAQIAKQGG
ncbi:MAG: hypothetical protein CFE39_11100 [Comamonadaceae bacterium PBBC2]|nr:MAG: hypothetical protein CFE39_11100 [Comamonadaceae bacterium PBBC2]